MPTAIAFETDGGAVVAADRVVTSGTTVTSRNAERVFGFDDCGAAAVSDPDAFEREVDAELRQYRTEHDESPAIEPFARIVGEVAQSVGTDAVALARDSSGRARVRAVYADGSVIDDSPLAMGSGAELAFGRLEAGVPADLAEAETFARDLIAGVSERDTRTGEAADVWTLADAE